MIKNVFETYHDTTGELQFKKSELEAFNNKLNSITKNISGDVRSETINDYYRVKERRDEFAQEVEKLEQVIRECEEQIIWLFNEFPDMKQVVIARRESAVAQVRAAYKGVSSPNNIVISLNKDNNEIIVSNA